MTSDKQLSAAPACPSWLMGLLIVLATVLAYYPAWHGGFLWDDDIHLTNNRAVFEPDGLKQIWTSRESQQFYPLVFTSFRLERALWGLNPTGYHWVNLLLHASGAVLLWRVLRRLAVPGAWLAGAVFALHPVNVESVAWITERKNTLAMFFYMVSALLYLRADGNGQTAKSEIRRPNAERRPKPETRIHHPRRVVIKGPSMSSGFGLRTSGFFRPSAFGFRIWQGSPPSSLFYWLSLVAFLLALLSKTAVSPFPLVLLGLGWWRRGALRRDVWRSLPFFVASLALGLVTVWFEARQTGFEIVRNDSFWSRLAGAGWVVWFYLFKAVLPLNLMPIYPRWQIEAAKAWPYLPGLLFLAALLVCWRYRRGWGRAWLAGMGYFALMLLPVLGFVNIGFMKFSLVADRWQYFAIPGPIALVSAGIALAVARMRKPDGSIHGLGRVEIRRPKSEGRKKSEGRSPKPEVPGPTAGLGMGLRSSDFGLRTSDFFRPSAFGFRVSAGLACCGVLLVTLGTLTWRQSSIFADAETFWPAALRANPGCWRAHYTYGDALTDLGRIDEAIAQYQQALQIQPDYAYAHNNLGNALRQKGQVQEAVQHYRRALELQPDLAWADCNLGAIALSQGRVDDAISHFQRALQSGFHDFQRPIYAPAGPAQVYYLLGCALARKGLVDEAITRFGQAVAIQPDSAEAHYQLATALLARHNAAGAAPHYREAIRLKPDWLEALNNLAWLLATHPDGHLRDGQEAAILAARAVALTRTNNAKLLDTLGAALAESGRFPEALEAANAAARLARSSAAGTLEREIQSHRQFYERGQPFREP